MGCDGLHALVLERHDEFFINGLEFAWGISSFPIHQLYTNYYLNTWEAGNHSVKLDRISTFADLCMTGSGQTRVYNEEWRLGAAR
jgi:hypothetical protein